MAGSHGGVLGRPYREYRRRARRAVPPHVASERNGGLPFHGPPSRGAPSFTGAHRLPFPGNRKVHARLVRRRPPIVGTISGSRRPFPADALNETMRVRTAPVDRRRPRPPPVVRGPFEPAGEPGRGRTAPTARVPGEPTSGPCRRANGVVRRGRSRQPGKHRGKAPVAPHRRRTREPDRWVFPAPQPRGVSHAPGPRRSGGAAPCAPGGEGLPHDGRTAGRAWSGQPRDRPARARAPPADGHPVGTSRIQVIHWPKTAPRCVLRP